MITSLVFRDDLKRINKRLYRKYAKYALLIDELNTHEVPKAVVRDINIQVETLNETSMSSVDFKKRLDALSRCVISSIDNYMLLSTKNYYRNLWVYNGLTIIAIPLGMAFAIAFNNYYCIGFGFPIGAFIGILIGHNMDRKLMQANRQLNIEI